MPWTAKDATRHTKVAKTDKLKKMWSSTANSVLSKCISDGGEKKKCEGKAVRIANSAVAKNVQENEMDNGEWTMASVAQTAIEVGLAVARETDEIANDEAAKTLDLLRSKWNELGETTQAPIVSIADVEVDGERVLLSEIVEFYRAHKDDVPSEGGGVSEEIVRQSFAEIQAYVKSRMAELDMSVGDYNDKIRGAFRKRFGRTGEYDVSVDAEPWVRDVFTDHPEFGNVVIVAWGEKLFSCDYKMVDDGVEFANKSEWKKASKTYKIGEARPEIEVAETEPAVEEPLIEFDEGDAEQGELEEVGHVLAIIEEGEGTRAAPLKMHVAIIEPGMGNAKMKRYYSAPMLRENAHMLKGAKMYPVNHRKQDKSVGNEVSRVLECPVGFTESGGPIALVGVFDEAFARNVRNRAALDEETLNSLECSVLGEGTMRQGKVNGKEAYIVESIDKVESVDWVTKAGAGGRALEIVENEEEGGITMTEEVVEEVVVVEEQPVDTGQPPPEDVVETEGEVQEALIAEAVAEEVDKTSLPEAFKNALKVREYADTDELAGAITKATEDFKAATGSGKPFGLGQTKKETVVAEGDGAPMQQKVERLNRILVEAGHSIGI